MPRPTAIFLDVPAEPLIARISARRQCPTCGKIYNVLSQPPRQEGICDADGAALFRREDDHEDVIRRRLQAYDEQTGPVIAYYQKQGCYRVDGAQKPEQVSAAIAEVLEKHVLAATR
jgi:adenylate kinase